MPARVQKCDLEESAPVTQDPNLGRGFPGKNAYVIWEWGRESRLSRHLRRVARERAIQHRRQWHRAWARVRELLAHRKAST